ncbi:MAG: hypothetical protein AAFV93_12660 [Chloroflexota bacterium]
MMRLIVTLLLIALSACAPTTSSPTSDNTNTDPIPTREGVDNSDEVTGDPGSGFGLGDAGSEAGFTADLSGAITATLANAGTINCENNGYVIRGSLDSFPQISLILPIGASPDTFTLSDNTGDGSVATATVFLQDGSVYASNVEGILIVNDLATEAGQAVKGSFDFSASSSNNRINARGEFDFISSENAVYC